MVEQRTAIAFVWENFGPGHADRVEAVAARFHGRRPIVGIELASKSDVYEWESEVRPNFTKVTLFQSESLIKTGFLNRTFRTFRACLQSKAKDIFFCHYEHLATFVSAALLRLVGKRVYMMNDSKYDDYARYLYREVGKAVLYLPYVGAIASGSRAIDYVRFLGIPKSRITGNYNCLSLERIRRLANTPAAPAGLPFRDRKFIIVARLVEKKNLFMAVDAFDIYQHGVEKPRPLDIYGSGPLEAELLAYIHKKGLNNLVTLIGFVQTEEVCRALGRSLALLLPSTEEQFGNVVIEAQALNIPVIVSLNCGARDQLIRSGVNGFLVEADNPRGLAFYMSMLDQDERLWRKMCAAAAEFIVKGDSSIFALAIEEIIGFCE